MLVGHGLPDNILVGANLGFVCTDLCSTMHSQGVIISIIWDDELLVYVACIAHSVLSGLV